MSLKLTRQATDEPKINKTGHKMTHEINQTDHRMIKLTRRTQK